MEDFLLHDISIKVLQFSALDAKYMYHSIPYIKDDMLECSLVFPSYMTMKLMLILLFNPLLPALDGLDKNICFMNVKSLQTSYIFLISCDWCSIVNGIIETARKNLVAAPGLIDSVDFTSLAVTDKYLDLVLESRTHRVTKKDTANWCMNQFGKKTKDLLLFSRIYLKFESLELKWCPFKRSKEFYYRNKDKRFLFPTQQLVYTIGEILSKHETITCNNCPKVVNRHFKYTDSNTQSIFQPLLVHMLKMLENKEVTRSSSILSLNNLSKGMRDTMKFFKQTAKTRKGNPC